MLKTYTVIGLYAENHQRYATTVQAETPDAAEAAVRAEAQADLLIAGVLEGAHDCADTSKIYGYQ